MRCTQTACNEVNPSSPTPTLPLLCLLLSLTFSMVYLAELYTVVLA